MNIYQATEQKNVFYLFEFVIFNKLSKTQITDKDIYELFIDQLNTQSIYRSRKYFPEFYGIAGSYITKCCYSKYILQSLIFNTIKKFLNYQIYWSLNYVKLTV